MGAGEESSLQGVGVGGCADGASVVLLETFVEQPRHAGTCYRAANWQYLGETAGRGKLDRQRRAALPRKAIFAYPLRRDFRAALGVS